MFGRRRIIRGVCLVLDLDEKDMCEKEESMCVYFQMVVVHFRSVVSAVTEVIS